VARHADIWHTFADGADLGEKSVLLEGYCRELGRNPADIERSTFVDGDPGRVGPALRQRGVGLFTVIVRGPGFDLTPVRRWLAWRDEQNAR
jgi:hypothetical protein